MYSITRQKKTLFLKTTITYLQLSNSSTISFSTFFSHKAVLCHFFHVQVSRKFHTRHQGFTWGWPPHRDSTWHKMLLGQHDFCNRASVNCESLEKLRARSHRLRVLHNHSHCSRARTIGDLDPVTRDTYVRSEVERRHIRWWQKAALVEKRQSWIPCFYEPQTQPSTDTVLKSLFPLQVLSQPSLPDRLVQPSPVLSVRVFHSHSNTHSSISKSISTRYSQRLNHNHLFICITLQLCNLTTWDMAGPQ